jgi:hypothetical protein
MEYVFNTPSHHRVHHGIDPRCIDRNYGGMLIVWDRVFGSFETEGSTVHYGTVKPLASFDPLWANLALWAHLVAVARKTRRLRDKVAIFVAPPEWLPEDHGGPVVVPPVSPNRRLFDPPVSLGTSALAGAALVASTVALVLFLDAQPTLSMPAMLGTLVAVVLLLTALGRALDRGERAATP